MNFLLLGDPHVQVNNLPESQVMMNVVYDTLVKNPSAELLILGDLYHTHSVVRAEVQTFWLQNLEKISKVTRTYILTGNHDMPGSVELEGKISSLDPLKLIRNVTVVSSPLMYHDVLMMPYVRDKNAFVKAVNSHKKASILFCHQTFDGSTFENGFYAPDGLDVSLLSINTIVSGHIHSEQLLEKNGKTIWYPGTPRWLTKSDAGQSKSIFLYDTDDKRVLSRIDMSEHIHPFVRVDVVGNDLGPLLDIQDKIKDASRLYVNITGNPEQIKKAKALVPPGSQVSTTFTESSIKKKSNKQSYSGDFMSYLDSQYEPTLVSKNELMSFLKETM